MKPKTASHATTPVGTALSRAVRAQARELSVRVPEALAGDATAVHRGRVASRRLREALAVLADVSDAKKARKDVRKITRALGPVRELDVALATFDDEAARAGFDRDAVAEVRRFIERERLRRAAVLQGARMPALDALAARADAIAAAAGEPEYRGSEMRIMRKRLQRRAARLVTAIDACSSLYAPERMHAVRIAVKKLRYAAELAQASRLWPLAGAVRSLKRVQEDLGTLHDLQILVACVDGAAARRRRSGLARGLRAVIDTLERDCRTKHAVLLPQLATLADVARGIDRQIHAVPPARPRMIRVRALTPAPRRRVV